MANKMRAEEAEATFPPEVIDQKLLDSQHDSLLEHLAPHYVSGMRGELYLEHAPQITVQIAPWSQNGAGCRLFSCSDRIKPYQYRIALKPGMNYLGNNWHKSPEYFHVECFEKLADLSSPEVLPFLHAETHGNIDGGYLLDSGAEILVREWIIRHAQAIGEGTSGTDLVAVLENTQSETDPSIPISNHKRLVAVLANTQSETDPAIPICNYKRVLAVPENTQSETDPSIPISNHKRRAADISKETSENPIAEGSSWDILSNLPTKDAPDFKDRHTLSNALARWNIDKRLATYTDEKLTEGQRKLKAELSERDIQAIQNLMCVVIMGPRSVQRIFHGC